MKGNWIFVGFWGLGPKSDNFIKFHFPFILGLLFLAHRVARVKIRSFRQNSRSLGGILRSRNLRAFRAGAESTVRSRDFDER